MLDLPTVPLVMIRAGIWTHRVSLQSPWPPYCMRWPLQKKREEGSPPPLTGEFTGGPVRWHVRWTGTNTREKRLPHMKQPLHHLPRDTPLPAGWRSGPLNSATLKAWEEDAMQSLTCGSALWERWEPNKHMLLVGAGKKSPAKPSVLRMWVGKERGRWVRSAL